MSFESQFGEASQLPRYPWRDGGYSPDFDEHDGGHVPPREPEAYNDDTPTEPEMPIVGPVQGAATVRTRLHVFKAKEDELPPVYKPPVAGADNAAKVWPIGEVEEVKAQRAHLAAIQKEGRDGMRRTGAKIILLGMFTLAAIFGARQLNLGQLFSAPAGNQNTASLYGDTPLPTTNIATPTKDPTKVATPRTTPTAVPTPSSTPTSAAETPQPSANAAWVMSGSNEFTASGKDTGIFIGPGTRVSYRCVANINGTWYALLSDGNYLPLDTLSASPNTFDPMGSGSAAHC